MIERNDVTTLSGATVRTEGGDKIGRVAQVYLDDQTGQRGAVRAGGGCLHRC